MEEMGRKEKQAVRLLDWEETADEGNGRYSVDGVSLEFLMEWAIEYPEYSTQQVCEKIKKKTKNKSFLDLLRQESPEHVGKASIFLSHCWSSNFHDTITAVNKQFSDDPSVKPESTFLWMDIICANQHSIDLAAEDEVATNRLIHDTRRIIRIINNTFIVITSWDQENLTVLSRAWCLWELLCTAPQHLRVALPVKESRQFMNDLKRHPDLVVNGINEVQSNLSLATRDIDTELLHSIFEQVEESGFEYVDKAVRSHFFRWIAESAWGHLVDLQKGIEREYEHGQVSSQPKRKSLRHMLRTQAIFLREVANAFKACKVYPYAIELYRGVLRDHERFRGQIDYDKISAINFSNLADIFTDAGQYEEAVEHYQKALEINRKLEPTLIPDTLNGIANNLWLLGRRQEAEENFEEIIQLDREAFEREKSSRTKRCLVTSLFNMGNHLETVDPARAIPFLEEAVKLGLDLYSEDESEDTLAETRGLSNLFFRIGQFDKAAHYRELLLGIQGLLHRDEKTGAMELTVPEHQDQADLTEEFSEHGDDFAMLAKANLQMVVGNQLGERSAKECLNESVVCARAAFDLHKQHYGDSNPVIHDDLRLLIQIETQRGNKDRVNLLRSRADEMGAKFVRDMMRKGPLAELRTNKCLHLERNLSDMLAQVKVNGNYEEVANAFETLGIFYLQKGSVGNSQLKAIAFLCEATKLRLFTLGGLQQQQAQQQQLEQQQRLAEEIHEEQLEKESQEGEKREKKSPATTRVPDMSWKISAMQNEVRSGLVRLFHLFSVAEKNENLVKHCASFVKMVQFFYRDESSDNGILALNLLASLLHKVKRTSESVTAYKEALTLADRVYQNQPNKQWISVLQSASLAYKANGNHLECLNLQKRVLHMYDQLVGTQDDQSVSNLYQVAATQKQFAESLGAEKEGSPSSSSVSVDDVAVEAKSEAMLSRDQLLKDAEQNLLQGISVLHRLHEMPNEENVAILRRELADLYIKIKRFKDAREQVEQVVNLHSLIYDEDDPLIAQDLEMLKWIDKQLKSTSNRSVAEAKQQLSSAQHSPDPPLPAAPKEHVQQASDATQIPSLPSPVAQPVGTTPKNPSPKTSCCAVM